MLPFRELLKPATPFHWDSNLDRLFEESKTVIISEIVNGVKIFDKSKPICLATDWSRHGIGCTKSIACAHLMTSFVVVVDGRSPWLEADLHTLQNPDMHQLKERLWQ